MKSTIQKLVKLTFMLLAMGQFQNIQAQAPQKMSYQAVIRDAGNVLISNAAVGVKISILQTTPSGTVVYSERHNPSTNINGLVTLEIGGGILLSGNFSTINWANGPYFVKTETDPIGGTNYTISATSQLLSVPFALYAATSGSSVSNWTTTGVDIANNNTGNVGIGTGATVPSSLLTVKKNGIGFTQENVSGISKIGFYTDGTSAWLQTHSNNDLTFSTNNGSAQMTLQKATGNLGIGVIVPAEKLEVAGKTKTTNLQVTTGAGAGKVLTSDATGNAAWQTPAATAVANQSYEKNATNLTTSIQGSIVDFPTTNIVAPVDGTYLITYFLYAHNSFSCSACYPGPNAIIETTAYLYNKTDNVELQNQDIDFLYTYGANDDNIVMKSHQISGSIVKSLNANDAVGFKMGSAAFGAPVGEIKIFSSNVTLVRLF